MNARNPDRTVTSTEVGGRTMYHVPSETHPGVVYDVFVDEDGQWVCMPCLDFAQNHLPCKHVFEVLDRFHKALAPPGPREGDDVPKGWYQGARRNEYHPFQYREGFAESTRHDHALEKQDTRVEELLSDLAVVLNKKHPPLPNAWRPELPAGDKVLITVLRAQHKKSIRKFRPILKRLFSERKVAFAPCKTTIIGYNKRHDLSELLREAFDIVTRPFSILDQQVIIDSTGFSPFYVSNWRDRRDDENAGRPPIDYRAKTEWFKVHIIIGRFSKAILGWAMTPYRGEGVGDPSLLEPLLLQLKARDHSPSYLIGDNAYITTETYAEALALGVQLVGPFRPRNFGPDGLPRGIAKRIHAFASLNPGLYADMTAARQAVEGTFSTEKKEDNHVAAIGSKIERDAHSDILAQAALASADDTLAETDREAMVKALEDEAAAAAVFVARTNEMLARAIRQVLRRTVDLEETYNRRISYTKGSVFGPVRETVE
jgi:hypothetical protein